jgi:GntR family transcriptional repressor for pyruvate dehydrogenase complex
MERAEKNIDVGYFKEIQVDEASDLIIKQIKELIVSGVLKAGDKLPAENTLAEKFGVGRGHIRKALRKLEFYGILKTVPQSGTVVASVGLKAMEGIISNILHLEKDDFISLIETRKILEVQATRLAALRATEEDKNKLQESHEEFKNQVHNEQFGLDEDLLFHIKIAECSKNNVLYSLLNLITPETLQLSQNLMTCDKGRYKEALKEHEKILKAIITGNESEAEHAMLDHMNNTIGRK